MIWQMLGIWSPVLLPFLNPSCTSGSSWFTYWWSLAWRILSSILLAREMSAIVRKFEDSLVLPFFGIEMKTPFPVLWPLLSFLECWHIECSALTVSSFRVWSSSAGIPSPPLALFIVMLPKSHLTSHSRMYGSRWVTIPWWLSRSLRPFLYSSSIYSCTIFLNSSAPVRSLLFLSFIVLIFAWNVPLVSPIFLKRSLVFPIVLFSSISLHCSLKKPFLSFSSVLWSSAFNVIYLSLSPFLFISLLFSAICRAFSDNSFAFLHFFFFFFFWWFWSQAPIQCY